MSPKTVVSPTTPAQSATRGRVPGSTPNAAHAGSDHWTASRSSSIVREAVAASVTYPAPRRCSSHVSVVVTTPSVVTFSRSQVIFGAAKYGSSGRPVMPASSAARPLSRSQMAAERRSCQTIARLSGFPVARSQASTVSPWLASATACAGTPGGGQGLRARADDGAPQLFRVGLHAVAVDGRGAHRDLSPAQDRVTGADQQRLRRRRALVDGEDVHSASGVDRIAAGSVTSWTT